jgi:hypothetical protein
MKINLYNYLILMGECSHSLIVKNINYLLVSEFKKNKKIKLFIIKNIKILLKHKNLTYIYLILKFIL